MKTKSETLAMIDSMSPADRAEVSDDWLVQLHDSGESDPGAYGFVLRAHKFEVGPVMISRLLGIVAVLFLCGLNGCGGMRNVELTSQARSPA